MLLFHICYLDISSGPTNSGFYFIFTDTKFLLDFVSNFNGMKFWGHILHPNFGVIYFAFDFVTNFLRHSCQLLAKECALSTGKLHRRLAQEQCG